MFKWLNLFKGKEEFEYDPRVARRGETVFSDDEMPVVLRGLAALVQFGEFPDFDRWNKKFKAKYNQDNPNDPMGFMRDLPEEERHRLWFATMDSYYKQKLRVDKESILHVLVYPSFKGEGYSIDYFFPYVRNIGPVHFDAYYSAELPSCGVVMKQLERDIELCHKKGIHVVISPEAKK